MMNIYSNKSEYDLYIEIAIYDFDFDPEVITKITGIIPTEYYTKGVNNRKRTMWKLSSSKLKSNDFSENWEWIKFKLANNYNKFSILPQKDQSRKINIVVTKYERYPDITIPSDLLIIAHEIWADIEIYHY